MVRRRLRKNQRGVFRENGHTPRGLGRFLSSTSMYSKGCNLVMVAARNKEASHSLPLESLRAKPKADGGAATGDVITMPIPRSHVS